MSDGSGSDSLEMREPDFPDEDSQGQALWHRMFDGDALWKEEQEADAWYR